MSRGLLLKHCLILIASGDVLTHCVLLATIVPVALVACVRIGTKVPVNTGLGYDSIIKKPLRHLFPNFH